MAYRIGAYLIDPKAYEIRLEGAPVPVEPQVFELLALLIANRERAVSRDEIIERIWNGRIVSEATLSSRIKSARRALGDDGSAQRLIRTIHGRGFRFVGEAEEVVLAAPVAGSDQHEARLPSADEDQARAAVPANRRFHRAFGVRLAAKLPRSRRWAMVAAAFALLFGGGLVLNHQLTRPAGTSADNALKRTATSLPPPGARKAGATFKDCDICPEMVELPAGEFMMGSPPHEAGRSFAEGPQRVVRLAGPFAIGRFEVTVDQFAAFVDAAGYQPAATCIVYAFDFDQGVPKPHTFRTPPYPVSGSHPASCVSWDDARAYVAWLAQRTGKSYRLPSEAEWEYAARAGTTTPFSFGLPDPATVCEHAKLSDAGTRFPWRHTGCDSGWGHGSAPVGKHKANAWGLHDMHGNVGEWVEDCWHDNFIGAPNDSSVWTAGGDCSRRVYRGGSWGHKVAGIRGAARHRTGSALSADNRGFRVALSLGLQ